MIVLKFPVFTTVEWRSYSHLYFLGLYPEGNEFDRVISLSAKKNTNIVLLECNVYCLSSE